MGQRIIRMVVAMVIVGGVVVAANPAGAGRGTPTISLSSCSYNTTSGQFRATGTWSDVRSGAITGGVATFQQRNRDTLGRIDGSRYGQYALDFAKTSRTAGDITTQSANIQLGGTYTSTNSFVWVSLSMQFARNDSASTENALATACEIVSS